MAGKLTATLVKKTRKPGKYADGGNLYLQVAKWPRIDGHISITKSWAFRYRRYDPESGKDKDCWMGLGAYPIISLKAAREAALDYRRKKFAGIDPLNDKTTRKRAHRIGTVKAPTFADCATQYIDTNKNKWKNEKHIAQWRATLKDIAGPVIGKMPVDVIDTDHVLSVIQPIWYEKTETANRVRNRIEAVLNWAKIKKYRSGDNPARWQGCMDNALPRPKQIKPERHHAALPYEETAEFLALLRKDDGIAARALELLILTATRTSEVIQAEWSEIDFDNEVWTIPAERMKAKRQHQIPLSPAAIEVLKAVEGHDNKYIFPGHKRSSHLSNGGMLAVLKRLKRKDITVHGFRSTIRDWIAETTNYPNIVAEMALAHSIKDKTEAAYRRGKLFKKRQKLMSDWATYCSTPLEAATVTLLRGRHAK